MTTATHTPGHAPAPWALCYDGQIDSADGQLVVALPFESYREFKESSDVVLANYRVMTAAPLLLAVLISMNHMGGDDRGGYCICPLNDGSAPNHKHATVCADARTAIAKAITGAVA
jgi:hypothetical protein